MRIVFCQIYNKYYKKILSEIADKNYDYLLVNRGEIVPEFFLQDLRNTQPNCQFIFYTWDSFANHTHPTTILKYFDKNKEYYFQS